MSRVCREYSLLRCGTCGEIECLEKAISQQAEIIKILSEACERISSGTYNSEVRMAIDALAQVEKLKGE